jgi:hypothetical protein
MLTLLKFDDKVGTLPPSTVACVQNTKQVIVIQPFFKPRGNIVTVEHIIAAPNKPKASFEELRRYCLQDTPAVAGISKKYCSVM